MVDPISMIKTPWVSNGGYINTHCFNGEWNPRDRIHGIGICTYTNFAITKSFLVGGFNPSEKYESNWTSSPNSGEHRK